MNHDLSNTLLLVRSGVYFRKFMAFEASCCSNILDQFLSPRWKKSKEANHLHTKSGDFLGNLRAFKSQWKTWGKYFLNLQ